MPMNTSHGETEYRGNFKQSRFSCAATTYKQNLNFRTEQKRRFVEHNSEPFAWDPEDIESDSGSDLSCDELNKPARLTLTQYKHEKLNRLYEKHKADQQEPVSAVRKSDKEARNKTQKDLVKRDERRDDTDEDESDSEASVVHIIQPELQPLKKSDSETSVVHVIGPEFQRESTNQREPTRKHGQRTANKQTQTDKKATQKEEDRPRHSKDKPHHSQDRPHSSQDKPHNSQDKSRHSKDKPHHSQDRPRHSPFVPYGYEADVKELGKKQTHNIRAAQGIYPAALRAKQLRKTTEQENRSKSRNGHAESGKNQKNGTYLRPTTSEPGRVWVHSDEWDGEEWMSEYDRNYQRYNPNEYRKGPNSARVHACDLLPQGSSHTRQETRQ